jgi:hypothetical protein
MKNKLFLVGMLGMILAFGITVTGCDNGDDSSPSRSYGFDVRNYSSVIVTVTFNGTINRTLPVDRNWKTSVELSEPLTSIYFTPETVHYETDEDGDITFYNGR